MTDLVKRLRELEAENKLMTHCEGVTREAIRKQILADMREFEKTYKTWPTSPSEFIDAYEKHINKSDYEKTFGNPPPKPLRGY